MTSDHMISHFQIISASLFTSAVQKEQFVRDGKKEIAFIGRSNVGKSSLVNSLCGRKKLAYISREPGKTRTINYYSVRSRCLLDGKEERQEWYLVDLPGYGFAKTDQKSKDSWSRFIADYMKNAGNLVMVGLLIDLRHPGLPIDQKAYEWLNPIAPHLQIIGTKADKLGKNEITKNLKLTAHFFPTALGPIASSAQKGMGREELLQLIQERICI